MEALRSDIDNNKAKRKGSFLPIITSDKKTFNIPDDVYNPAFQVSLTTYHYPDKCGSKFLCKLERGGRRGGGGGREREIERGGGGGDREGGDRMGYNVYDYFEYTCVYIVFIK